VKPCVKAPPWTDSYCLGISEVDREHRGLFAALNDLSAAMSSADWPTVRRILQVIPKDAAKHFRREERLMQRARFSGLEWHRKQHTTARKRIEVLVEAALLDGTPHCEAVLAYFRAFLPMHIKVHDRMMSASLRNFARWRSLPRARRWRLSSFLA